MVERKGRGAGSGYPKIKTKPKTEIKQVPGERVNYESFRVVLLSLLTPRSSSSRRALWVLRRVPMDMASLERGEEPSLPLEEQGRES